REYSRGGAAAQFARCHRGSVRARVGHGADGESVVECQQRRPVARRPAPAETDDSDAQPLGHSEVTWLCGDRSIVANTHWTCTPKRPGNGARQWAYGLIAPAAHRPPA